MKILQELPDMQQANDFNDNIGVPRVSDELKFMSDRATQGVWGQYHGRNGPWREKANADDYTKWDSTHDISAMTNNGRYPIGHFKHVDTAAFVEALVNAYRAGDLVPASQVAEARNAALDEAIEAITFEAEGRKKQMDAHKHDAVQHERFRIGELQSRLNVKNVDALKTEPSQMTSTDIVERVARAIHCYDGRLPAPWCDDLQSDNFWIGEKETAMRQARAAIAAMPSPDVGWQPIETAKDMEPKDG